MAGRQMDSAAPTVYKCSTFWFWFASISTIVLSILLIIFAVTVVKPRIDVRDFVEANCTVVEQRFNVRGDVSCGCGKNCQSSYPCHQVLVNYTKSADGDDTTTSYGPTVIYYDETQLYDGEPCSFSKCTDDAGDNDRDIQDLMSRYNVSVEFTCLYNPNDLPEVIITRQTEILHFLLWPAVGVGICLLVSLLTCSKCRVGMAMNRDLKRARWENRVHQIPEIVKSYTNAGYAPDLRQQTVIPSTNTSNLEYSNQYWQGGNTYSNNYSN